MHINKRKSDAFNFNLDEEEQELSDALDQAMNKGKLNSVDNLAEELIFAKIAATNYLHKVATVNIPISNDDLARLKQEAAYKGLAYEALIANVIHQYAAGHFEKN